MELWQEMIRNSVSTVDHLVEKFSIDREVAAKLDEFFQARINPYYLSLIRYPGDPIWQQCVPDVVELEDIDAPEDPLNEDEMSPVPNITHRYPDRALFLVTSQCGLYCRFCTRKRKVGDQSKISMRTLESAFNYLEQHTEISDVILSGGDPLMLTDTMLEKILIQIKTNKTHTNNPSRIKDAVCTSAENHTAALRDAEKISSDILQYAFQSSVGNHRREQTSLRNACRCGHSGW